MPLEGQASKKGLKLNGTLQLMVSADVNVLDGTIHTIKEDTETVIVVSKLPVQYI
jgi:hypothetical protein